MLMQGMFSSLRAIYDVACEHSRLFSLLATKYVSRGNVTSSHETYLVARG